MLRQQFDVVCELHRIEHAQIGAHGHRGFSAFDFADRKLGALRAIRDERNGVVPAKPCKPDLFSRDAELLCNLPGKQGGTGGFSHH